MFEWFTLISAIIVFFIMKNVVDNLENDTWFGILICGLAIFATSWMLDISPISYYITFDYMLFVGLICCFSCFTMFYDVYRKKENTDDIKN